MKPTVAWDWGRGLAETDDVEDDAAVPDDLDVPERTEHSAALRPEMSTVSRCEQWAVPAVQSML